MSPSARSGAAANSFLSNAGSAPPRGAAPAKVWGRAIHHFFESLIRYYRKAHGPWSANAVKTMVIGGGAALRMKHWTVLGRQLGLTPEVRKGLARRSGNSG